MKAIRNKSLVNEVEDELTEDEVVNLISIHGGSGSGASQVSELTDNNILARVGASNDFQNSSTTTNKFNTIEVDSIKTLSDGSYTALAVADLSDNSSVAKTGASNDFKNSTATTNQFNTIEVDTIKTLNSSNVYVDNIPRLDNTTNNFKSGQSQNNTSKFDVVEADTIIVTKGNQSRTITSNVSNPDAGLDAAALVSGDLPIARIPDSTLPIKKLDYGCFNEFRIATELGPSFIDSNGYETIKMITELYRFGTFPTDDEKLINFDGETTNGLIPLDSSDAAYSGAHEEHTRATYGPIIVYHDDVDVGNDPQNRAALFNFDYHGLTLTGQWFFPVGAHVNMASQVVAVTRGYVYTGAPVSLADNLKPRTTWKGNPFHSDIRAITDTTRTLWEVGVSAGEATRIKINDESIFVSANTIGSRGGTMGYKYKIFTNIGKYIYVETITMNPHNADLGFVGLVFRCLGVSPTYSP